MGYLNAEYGSELHLLRMLARHREYFNKKVCGATGADEVVWLDFPSGKKRVDKNEHIQWDREWMQLAFLALDDPAQGAWKAAWPRPAHNWDAIGRLRYRTQWEWLLVEAKANTEEIESECGAEDPESIALINRTLNATKAALGAPPAADWTRPYYQVCNRLALLNILYDSHVCARLLFVYFCGDAQQNGRHCPADQGGWAQALKDQEAHVGLGDTHKLKPFVHKCFVDVECPK